MTSATLITMNDIARQKPYETDLSEDLSPDHRVGQAVEQYLSVKGIPPGGERWQVFSRGVKLDMKTPLKELEEVDNEWLVMPAVSAG